jgi:hypothetical protein
VKVEIFSKDLDIYSWDHCKEIIDIRGMYGLKQFQERLQNGSVLVCALYNNELTGFYWGEIDPIVSAGYKLNNNVAYGLDCFIFNKFRKNGIHPVLHKSLQIYIRDHYPEKKILLSHVATWNQASYKGNLLAGCNITKLEISFVLLGFHRKILIRNIPPKNIPEI